MPWHRQRAGSLRTLNGTAVHLGLTMLLDWLTGEMPDQSAWLRLELGAAGPALEMRQVEAQRPGCPVCSRGVLGSSGSEIDGAFGDLVSPETILEMMLGDRDELTP